MSSSVLDQRHRLNAHWIYFILALLLVCAAYSIYALNIVRWRNSPDYGWRAIYESGPNVVGEVLDAGKYAGLRAGDIIIAINGQGYSSFEELYFKVRRNEPGSVNSYTVMRNGETLEINIPTGRLGLKAVLERSGTFFVVGLLYVLVGILVFMMKPMEEESWLFFVMTSVFGMEVSFLATSDLIRPLNFFDFRLLIDVILPAPIIHLALKFPKERAFIRKAPWLPAIPYLVSITLFVLYKTTSTAYWHDPPVLSLINDIYLMLAVLIFLLSMIWNLLKDPSNVIKLQSQVILIGIALGLFLPAANLLALKFWQVHLFPHPTLAFAICLLMFPLSIGYTIVRHDLFAIDVIVRRTYGYILSTTAVLCAYGIIVLTLNLIFQSSQVSHSPAFSIVFALGMVFFFRPLHERFQAIVDRVFYRRQYDYRKTLRDTSEAMISILDSDEIHRKLIGSVVREMFLENGLLLVPDLPRHVYRVQVVEGTDEIAFRSAELAADNAVLQLLDERKDAIFRHEIDLNPAWRYQRESLVQTFDSLACELLLPLTYKGELRGIVSLGKKKSGKMFTLEDLDLLKTITNQSSIALENARLFAENMEKSRMEKELKIAHDLQASMLPEKAPKVPGFEIAATSIPAREVGGDFYDFIATGSNGGCDRLGIIVGDVSGKAVSGALVMAAARSIFRVLTEANASVKEVMSTGNSRLIKDVKKGMFVALLYAILDPSKKSLILSNAGQTQPVLCPAQVGEPRYIDTEGDRFPLGILQESKYEETLVPLEIGDTLLFYTDGVVEAMNVHGEMYGFDRLLTSVGDSRNRSAEGLLQKLMADINDFVGTIEQHDDLTMVVVKVV